MLLEPADIGFGGAERVDVLEPVAVGQLEPADVGVEQHSSPAVAADEVVGGGRVRRCGATVDDGAGLVGARGENEDDGRRGGRSRQASGESVVHMRGSTQADCRRVPGVW